MSINSQYPKGSDEQKHLKEKVMDFLSTQKIYKLTEACEKTGHDYQLIYGQLNGYRACKTKDIDSFVKGINPNYQVEILNNKPAVTKIGR